MSIVRRIINKIKYYNRKRYIHKLLRALNATGGGKLSVPGVVKVIVMGDHSVAIGDYVTLWNDVKLSVCGSNDKTATLTIEDHVSIGDRTEIHTGENVRIGRGTLIAWDCCIMDRDYHCIDGISEHTAPVVIGENVWIGCNVLILKGVTIGEGAVIGAGSVVTRDIPPCTLAVGNPAKVVRTGVHWKP